MKTVPTLTSAIVLLTAGVVTAGEVEIAETHICCPACVRDIGKALDDVEGVSGVQADREEKTITFTAADEDAAEAAIEALADAGFHGQATHDDEELSFPESGAKEDAKANEVTVSHVHMCCPQCVRAIEGAMGEVDGVSEVTCDREENTCTVAGSNVSVEAVVAALNGAGFNATIEE